MKNLLLLFIASVLIPLSSVFSQSLNEYLSAVKGDTLVVKDYYDMGDEPNSLYYVLLLDTIDVPAGRVYELKANGYYPHWRTPKTSASHPTVITGPDAGMLVTNKSKSLSPPLICTYPMTVEFFGGILANNDLIIKNCELIPGDIAGSTWWNFIYTDEPNIHVLFENCLFERTRWVFMFTTGEGSSWHISNCYFVNMSGQPCRRNGGVFDCFDNQDTLIVENSTHVMGQGRLYNLKANQFNRVIFNHNTFINSSHHVLHDWGSQSAMSVTNNIFVNCQTQPYSTLRFDFNEDDIEKLPMGLINVYPDTAVHAERRILVDKNLIYWDSRLADIVNIVNANIVNGANDWVSEMITMNDRTQSMFDDSIAYPYLTEGVWYNELPDFSDPKDLLTDQVDVLKAFSIETVDTGSTSILPTWRVTSTGDENWLYSDWPIPVDLSYSDPDLQTAGFGRFPLGDLNWFPAEKEQWLAQRTAEYNSINSALNSGKLITAIGEHKNLPARFELQQNYPNPFNPVTIISYQLSKISDVSLVVYDVLGQQVRILVNKKQSVGTHQVQFDGSALASGIYIYSLTTNGHQLSKKMVLMK